MMEEWEEAMAAAMQQMRRRANWFMNYVQENHLVGYYVNPKGITKETFLDLYGRRLPGPPPQYRTQDSVVVCLVDNVQFTAAAVAYSQSELEYFSQNPEDKRPKKWYLLPIRLLDADVQEAVR